MAAQPLPSAKRKLTKRPNWRSRGWWLKHVTRWHWISSAMSLACILFFAVTGLTLNHAASISATPSTIRKSATLPAADLKLLEGKVPEGEMRRVPARVAEDAAKLLALKIPNRTAEWAEDVIDLDLSGPGSEGTLTIDRASGALDYELTRHGWVAWANDLHKGKNAGSVWFWLIDLFAVGVLVFALTGLYILQFHARNRPKTWPMVGFGVALPVIAILLFVHS